MSDDAPTLEDLDAMNYTDRVIQESLRMYPPAWSLFVRQALEPFTIGDHTFKEGQLIYISPWVVHHDERWWEDPYTFDPSRFLGDWKADRPSYAFMPFGGGPRVCLASHMAEMEAETILATIVKHFKIELSEPDQEVPVDPLFTVQPKGGMHLRVRKR
jgi:cytochrome P450